MREAIGRIIGAGVGFLVSLIPAWMGLTEAMSADLQTSLTAALVTVGYAVTHKTLRAKTNILNDN